MIGYAVPIICDVKRLQDKTIQQHIQEFNEEIENNQGSKYLKRFKYLINRIDNAENIEAITNHNKSKNFYYKKDEYHKLSNGNYQVKQAYVNALRLSMIEEKPLMLLTYRGFKVVNDLDYFSKDNVRKEYQILGVIDVNV